MMQSVIQQVGHVEFPVFTGERVHMVTFHREEGLPENLRRWDATVNQMLAKLDTDLPITIMIDQGHVDTGKLHRRGGLHIDGFWVPGTLLGGGRHHQTTTPGFKTQNQIDWENSPEYKRRQRIQERLDNLKIRKPKHNAGANFVDEFGWPIEAIVLASDVAACRALVGEWDGEIGDGGDVTHLDLSHMQEVMFEANTAYAGNVTFVHESLPVKFACDRTVVRLNVPGYVIH